MRQNMKQLSLQDPRGRELAAAEVVKGLAEATGTSTYIPLATKSGASLNVSIEKPSTSKALFDNKPVTMEEFDKVAEKLRLSRNQQKDLATGLRVWKGRDFLEPRLDQKLSQKRKTGAEFFGIQRCEMDCKNDEGKNIRDFRPVFYCKDVIGLFRFVSQRRGYHSQTELIELFGCDKGGKILPSLKRTVNIKKVVSEFSSPQSNVLDFTNEIVSCMA